MQLAGTFSGSHTSISKIAAGELEVKQGETFSRGAVVNQTASLANTIMKQKHKNIKFICETDSPSIGNSFIRICSAHAHN